MNRKDLVSLMEAYEDVVLDKDVEMSPEEGVDLNVDAEPVVPLAKRPCPI